MLPPSALRKASDQLLLTSICIVRLFIDDHEADVHVRFCRLVQIYEERVVPVLSKMIRVLFWAGQNEIKDKEQNQRIGFPIS